jgi:hypothetical protein
MPINKHALGNTDGTTQHHRGLPTPKASTKTDGGFKREGTYAPDQSKMTENEEIAAQKSNDMATTKEMTARIKFARARRLLSHQHKCRRKQ